MSLGECQSKLEVVRQELAEMRDKYLRVAATTDNTRKQAERNAAVRANERVRSFSLSLLEVVDNLERALQHASLDDALRPGVEATRQQLLAALRQEGVVPLPTQPGAAFDPQIHKLSPDTRRLWHTIPWWTSPKTGTPSKDRYCDRRVS